MNLEFIPWVVFLILIFFFLALDLGFFRKEEEKHDTYHALMWSLFWIFLALCFNVLIYFVYEHNLFSLDHAHKGGQAATLEFFTGYLLEKSLSLDNILVIAAIFTHYHIPSHAQKKVLLWGIIGAVFFRAVMILTGVIIFEKYTWVPALFGLFLIYTSFRLLFLKDESGFAGSKFTKLLRSVIPITPQLEGEKFFVKISDKWFMTPLFLALIKIEISDIIFAVDSIPAILAITTDPFIVLTSNVFAILGLRSLYLLGSHAINRITYLKHGLAGTLLFIGLKLILKHTVEISTVVSLVTIVAIMGTSVIASIIVRKNRSKEAIIPLPEKVKKAVVTTTHQVHRLFILVAGITVVLIGIAMLILPGPGLLVIPLGLLILATEFSIARRWVKKIAKLSSKKS